MNYDDYMIQLRKNEKVVDWPEIEFDQNLNPDFEDISDLEIANDSASKAKVTA